VNVPYCYFPKDFPTYKVVNSTVNNDDADKPTRTYIIEKTMATFRHNEILRLAVDVTIVDVMTDLLRVRIYDPSNKRYEVPLDINLNKRKHHSGIESNLNVVVVNNPFAIKIYRKTTKTLL
jgi:hypothetical protein